MEIKRKALGKGLEELFGSEAVNFEEYEKNITEMTPKEEIQEINLNEIRPNPYQPRKIFDEDALHDLASSIREHGVFQPVILKKSTIKGYEIVAGERRVKASKIAGKATIPAIVKDFSDDDMMQIALLENLQREDLTPIEEASAYIQLIEKLDLTHEELAKRVGKSRSHITNMIGLLRLPDEIIKMLVDKKITMGHARTLSKMENKDEMVMLARKIVNEDLNVRKAEGLSSKKASTIKKSRQYLSYEKSLSEELDRKVRIKSNKIELYFNNEKDMVSLLQQLGVEEDE